MRITTPSHAIRFCRWCAGVLLALSSIMARDVLAQSGASPVPASAPFRGFPPEGCVQVPYLVGYFAAAGRPDSLAFQPRRDTLSRAARAQVQRCADAYGNTTDRPWQLLNAARVYRMLQQDAAAKTVTDQYLTALGTADTGRRNWALYLVVMDNVSAQPPRLDAARPLLAELDRLGAPAARTRVLAHAAMAEAARRLFDDDLARSEANGAIAAAWQLSEYHRLLFVATELTNVLLLKGELELRRRGGDVARPVMDTAVMLVPRRASGWQKVNEAREAYQVVGKPAAAIDAAFWFTPNGMQAIKPTKGVVTILSDVPHYCGTGCQNRILELRRLAVRFAGRPVEQVHLAKTRGFYRDTAPIPPDHESRTDSAYFFGFARLTGSLAVYNTPFRFRVDDRRVNALSPQEVHYPNAKLVIVDKRGIVRYVDTGYGALEEDMLARFIEQLLTEPD